MSAQSIIAAGIARQLWPSPRRILPASPATQTSVGVRAQTAFSLVVTPLG
jgi:hypothetical protein